MLPPKIFGCVVFVHLHKNQCTKLEPCAVRCLFLGYGLHKKGFRCYDPKTNQTYTIMDVTFLEFEIFFPSPVPNSSLQGEITQVEESNWLMTPMGEHNCEHDTGYRTRNSSTEHELETKRMNCIRYNQSMTSSIELLITALIMELETERMNNQRVAILSMELKT